ncbi:hypothetical protein [Halopiger djelfimassiliensis]|uniref:hypothetical protein n=1 Tax=Halopiger djelfimassiliensis TaxID=1293047 RepID=UPI000677AD49|nr:hypothetical protein [Halopiger djelfimassiliensis]
MNSRRSILHNAAAIATGGLALLGRTAAGSVSSRRNRSTAESASRSRSGTGTAVGSRPPTTITARANRSAIRTARVPEHLAPFVAALEERIDPVSLDAVHAVTGTAGVVDGTPVTGSAVATGSFPADTVRSTLRQEGFTAVESRDGVERFVDGEFAIAPTRSAVAIGYSTRAGGRQSKSAAEPQTNPETHPAVGHADAALGIRARGSAGRPGPATAGHLESVPDGDVSAVADLGSGTRTRLRRALADAPDPLAATVGVAERIGASASVRSAGRTDVTYGFVVDPDRVTIDSLESVLEDADANSDRIRNVRVERDGRTVVVDADVSTEGLLQAHADVLDCCAL